MTITTDRDKELWVVLTEAWEIPVYATPVKGPASEDYCLILPAAGSYAHRMALGVALQPDSLMKEPDRWLVPRGTLERVATKAPGITPSFYLRARGEEAKTQEFVVEEPVPAPAANEELIQAVYQRTRMGKPGLFRVVWAALIDQIAHQLLIERRPVDLGWFKLHALPYRTNWKHNLLAKHPDLPGIMNNSAAQRAIAMDRYEVTPDLVRTDMMATRTIKGKTLFTWTVEVETTKQWEDYQEALELSRLASGNSTSYLSRWGVLVRESRKTINALLLQWLGQMARSAGQPIARTHQNGQRLVPYIPEKGGRPTRVDRMDVPLVVRDRPTEVRGPKDEENAFRKTRKVQELPVLEFDYSHLRNSGRDVPDGGGDDAAGMLVLPATGGEPPRETVLGGGDGAGGPGVV